LRLAPAPSTDCGAAAALTPDLSSASVAVPSALEAFAAVAPPAGLAAAATAAGAPPATRIPYCATIRARSVLFGATPQLTGTIRSLLTTVAGALGMGSHASLTAASSVSGPTVSHVPFSATLSTASSSVDSAGVPALL